VNAVCPGLVETDFWSGQVTPEQFQQIGEGYSKKAVLNRVATADDIARSILFFIDGDPNVTGQILASESGIGLVL
jgi:NAD(P)-dependent dehydrogenase (short-subunit alcohol dehydrogenase family)